MSIFLPLVTLLLYRPVTFPETSRLPRRDYKKGETYTRARDCHGQWSTRVGLQVFNQLPEEVQSETYPSPCTSIFGAGRKVLTGVAQEGGRGKERHGVDGIPGRNS